MQVEFLWFEGCPNHATARQLLDEALAELGLDVAVEGIQVETDEAALTHHFQGSPTVRVNGLDVDPIALDEMPYGMACRIYLTDEGPKGWPAKSRIVDALVAAQAETARSDA